MAILKSIPSLLGTYFSNQRAIYELFGYQEDWVVIPISDDTGHAWWWLSSEGRGGKVIFGDEDVRKDIETEKYYSHSVYTQRFLQKWVYKTQTHTMVCSNTHTDGNKFLCIFDNSKLVTDPELIKLLQDADTFPG